jgi:hypothetical protein
MTDKLAEDNPLRAAVDEQEGTAIVAAPPPANLWGVEPAQVIVQAARVARPLAEVLKTQNLSVVISNRRFVTVEGWTLLGSMLGVFPITVWSRPVGEESAPVGLHGWEACVEARTRDGSVVGRAEAQCTRSEKMWMNRDDYALRAMAQTRATSRAMRGPLGFVVKLAGFEATAAEEMPRDD